MEIILYSTGCPKCKVLEKKMNNAGLEFKIETDNEKVKDACEKLGILSVPILEIDGRVYSFTDAVKIIKEGI